MIRVDNRDTSEALVVNVSRWEVDPAFLLREPQDTLLPGMLGRGVGWHQIHHRGGWYTGCGVDPQEREAVRETSRAAIMSLLCEGLPQEHRSSLPQEGSAWAGFAQLRRSAINKSHGSLEYIILLRSLFTVLFWILKKPIFTFFFFLLFSTRHYSPAPPTPSQPTQSWLHAITTTTTITPHGESPVVSSTSCQE